MPPTPAVSVIIPTYNRAKTIERAIDSVLNQTFSDLELIVVDDCSTDFTVDVIKQYTDERLIYIRHENNRGEGGARNTGIRNSRAKYIAFLDSDDEWFPNKLEKQMPVIQESDSKVGIVYSHYIMQYEDGSGAHLENTSIKG
ncbi:MAG: glycosyltransferase family 2 protein, partial [Saprospiraceae bacterium]